MACEKKRLCKAWRQTGCRSVLRIRTQCVFRVSGLHYTWTSLLRVAITYVSVDIRLSDYLPFSHLSWIDVFIHFSVNRSWDGPTYYPSIFPRLWWHGWNILSWAVTKSAPNQDRWIGDIPFRIFDNLFITTWTILAVTTADSFAYVLLAPPAQNVQLSHHFEHASMSRNPLVLQDHLEVGCIESW